MKLLLIVAFVFGCAVSSHAQGKIAVFVAPQTLDGYVNVDAGILDSIRDVQSEMKRSSTLTVARTAQQATIRLYITGRRTPGSAGSIGIPAGTTALYFPINRRAIDAVLQVNAYERQITGESDNDSWSSAARAIVKNIDVWVKANKAQLR